MADGPLSTSNITTIILAYTVIIMNKFHEKITRLARCDRAASVYFTRPPQEAGVVGNNNRLYSVLKFISGSKFSIIHHITQKYEYFSLVFEYK